MRTVGCEMYTIDTTDLWDRWVALGRLHAEFLARGAEVGSASLDSVRQRLGRMMELWLGTPWPLLGAGLVGPALGGSRWADYLEDETRNAAQALLLTDWEMRDWGRRFSDTASGAE